MQTLNTLLKIMIAILGVVLWFRFVPDIVSIVLCVWFFAGMVATYGLFVRK